MTRPFDGVTVLDVTHVLAGPYCTYQLALLGAEVIKIEPPGDPDCARQRGPDDALNAAGMGINYQVQGANKRALALDLANDKGREAFRALVARADVLVDNFRTGALGSLGLGAEDLRRDNPRLIHCAITGYGQIGVRATVGAYDNGIQAASGLMARTGSLDAPVKTGASLVDYATGMTAAFAIAAALFRRERTGEGEAIDVAMFDTALTLMAPEVAAVLRGGAARPREAGLGTYRAAEGQITLGVFTPAQNRRFWSALGHDAFASLDGWEGLWRAADAMRAVLERIIPERTADEWEAWLHALQLPGERVRSLAEAVAMPHLAERGFLADVGGVTVPLAGYRFAGDGPAVTAPPPRHGEHSDAVLAQAGLDAPTIAALYAAGVAR